MLTQYGSSHRQGLIKDLEKVQMRATKLVMTVKHLTRTPTRSREVLIEKNQKLYISIKIQQETQLPRRQRAFNWLIDTEYGH